MRHLEAAEQCTVIEWSVLARTRCGRQVRDFLFAIPNGGNRFMREAARLKKEGVTAGVSDLFLAYPAGKYAGMFIEMKKQARDFDSESRARSAVTSLQRDFLDRMESVGYKAIVAYGATEAIKEIDEYLSEDY